MTSVKTHNNHVSSTTVKKKSCHLSVLQHNNYIPSPKHIASLGDMKRTCELLVCDLETRAQLEVLERVEQLRVVKTRRVDAHRKALRLGLEEDEREEQHRLVRVAFELSLHLGADRGVQRAQLLLDLVRGVHALGQINLLRVVERVRDLCATGGVCGARVSS